MRRHPQVARVLLAATLLCFVVALTSAEATKILKQLQVQRRAASASLLGHRKDDPRTEPGHMPGIDFPPDDETDATFPNEAQNNPVVEVDAPQGVATENINKLIDGKKLGGRVLGGVENDWEDEGGPPTQPQLYPFLDTSADGEPEPASVEVKDPEPFPSVVWGTDNLYQTSWAHAYVESENLQDAQQGRPIENPTTGPFNFARYKKVLLSVDGQMQYTHGQFTDANGMTSLLYHDLPKYALIGVWSRFREYISPVGRSFFIGTPAILIPPLGYNAYLFVGMNDDDFTDNDPTSKWTITVTASNVPPTADELTRARIDHG